MYSKRAILLWETIGVGIIVLANLVTIALHPIGIPVVSTPICVGIAIALTFAKSSAHLNPAVTGFLTIFAKIRPSIIAVYLAAAIGIAVVLPASWRLIAANGLLPSFPVETVDPGFIVYKETFATLCLLGYITMYILANRGIWTTVGIPIFLCLMQLTPLGGADMNPAVSVAWFVSGMYTWPSFAAHLIGEIIAMCVFLIVGHGLGGLRRAIVARRNG